MSDSPAQDETRLRDTRPFDFRPSPFLRQDGLLAIEADLLNPAPAWTLALPLRILAEGGFCDIKVGLEPEKVFCVGRGQNLRTSEALAGQPCTDTSL